MPFIDETQDRCHTLSKEQERVNIGRQQIAPEKVEKSKDRTACTQEAPPRDRRPAQTITNEKRTALLTVSTSEKHELLMARYEAFFRENESILKRSPPPQLFVKTEDDSAREAVKKRRTLGAGRPPIAPEMKARIDRQKRRERRDIRRKEILSGPKRTFYSAALDERWEVPLISSDEEMHYSDSDD